MFVWPRNIGKLNCVKQTTPTDINEKTVSLKCSLKVFAVYKYIESFMALLFTFRTMSRRINERSIHSTVLRTGLLKTYNLLLIFSFGVVCTAGIIIIVPAKVFITEQVLIPLFPMEFPYLDLATTRGMLISNFFQCVMGFYGAFGYLPIFINQLNLTKTIPFF